MFIVFKTLFKNTSCVRVLSPAFFINGILHSAIIYLNKILLFYELQFFEKLKRLLENIIRDIKA